jgi:hypothetical protein
MFIGLLFVLTREKIVFLRSELRMGHGRYSNVQLCTCSILFAIMLKK